MAVKITEKQAYAYAELLEILSFTDENLVNKIPKKLMNIFQTNASTTYENHLTASIPLEEQDVSKKTAALIALLSLNYWCETEDEKNELKSILAENQRIKEEKLREKYNPDNIFNNKAIQEETITQISQEETYDVVSSNLPIDYSNLPWYKKVFTSFRNFLLKIFNKEKNPT